MDILFLIYNKDGDTMKCPKCGKENKKNYCMYCGYMFEKDTYIDKNKTGEANLIETYLGYNYDKIVRNKNWFSRLILGPLYISIKGFIIPGLLLFFLDLFLFYCCFLFNDYFPLPGFGGILNILLIIFNRVLWMSIDNIIYLKLLDRKLNKIKDNNPNNYRELIDLEQRKHSDIVCLLYTVCILASILLIIFLIHINIHK